MASTVVAGSCRGSSHVAGSVVVPRAVSAGSSGGIVSTVVRSVRARTAGRVSPTVSGPIRFHDRPVPGNVAGIPAMAVMPVVVPTVIPAP